MASSVSNIEGTTSRVSITPPSLAQDPNLNAIRQKASVPGSKYAFLVHSTDSLRNGEDPSIDNKPLARQKRRRTSPEDQAILEASFARNPKPDKAARMALVGKVALGEKEVQIWFQNRRQSTRRKSRPLEPHEMASLAHGSPFSSPYDASPASDSRAEKHDDDSPSKTGGHASETSKDAGEDKENADPADDTPRRVQMSEPRNASTSFADSLQFASSQESNSGRWLSNKRSAAPFRSFHESMSQTTEPDSEPASQETPDAPVNKGLKKASSIIRLSFGADGSAIVRNGDSPSPPRKQLPPPVTPGDAIAAPQLSRSYSATTLNEPGSQESTKSNSLRRVSSFRSHDSRAWEFFCDRDVRSELEERADQEQSGSAADAIKLARSNSAKSLRRSLSLSAKRNAAPYAEVSSSKRVKTAAAAEAAPSSTLIRHMQPLQQRSLSASNPRRATYSQAAGQKLIHKTPKLKQTSTFEVPATDSDKENWSPERHLNFIQSMTTSPAVPPTTTSKRRAPLGQTPLRHGTSPVKTGTGRRWRGKVQVIVMEDDDDDEDDDEEVAAFMGEGGSSGRDAEDSRTRQSRKSDSVSEEEDLDCVQGLLSLSQGAWR